ncbi:MAG: ComEC/Rec2 family competence protein [Alphaproteobacteria bacterium]|nr:ComEC/Rec2 family competence protein [Alphaproteobacteria bacterium]
MNPLHAAPLSILADAFLRERTRWPYWLPVAIAAGICLYFALPFEPPLWAVAAPVPLALGAWALRHTSWPAAVLLFTLTLAATSFASAQIETRMAERPMLDRTTPPTGIQGRVAMTEIMPDGIRITLTHPRIVRVPFDATPEKIRVKFSGLTLADAPPAGADIDLYGQIGGFSEPVAPGATDFRRLGYFKHLGGLGWSYSPIKILDPAPPVLSWRERFALFFERMRKMLARHVYQHLSGDVAAMTATRLNGEQTAISPPVIEAMRIAGLSHLLSTSGFHVTIMALLIYFPLRAILALIPWLALRYPIKKWAAGAAIFSALGYTFLVGSQAATLRSMIMTGLAMLAITLDRRASPLRLVMMSAGLCMLAAPDATLGPSFQMSFAAVFCLVATHQRAWEFMTGDFSAFVPEWMKSATAHLFVIARTSLIATAATTPFSIYHFQSFSLYGFIANMLAIPLTSFWVMPAILMAYLTAPFNLDGWFIDAAGAGVALTIHIATTVAAWPGSIFYWPAMPVYILIPIVVGGLWLCLWRETWRYWGLLPIAVGMMYPLYIPTPAFFVSPDGREWAARLDNGTLAVSNLDHDAFAVRQWQQRLGNVPALDVTALSPDDKQLRCDDMGCVYRHGPTLIAMPATEPAALEDCGKADIVIAPFLINRCAAPQVIDDHALWQHGAAAIYFDGNTPRIVQSRPARGARPWSVGWRGFNITAQ